MPTAGDEHRGRAVDRFGAATPACFAVAPSCSLQSMPHTRRTAVDNASERTLQAVHFARGDADAAAVARGEGERIHAGAQSWFVEQIEENPRPTSSVGQEGGQCRPRVAGIRPNGCIPHPRALPMVPGVPSRPGRPVQRQSSRARAGQARGVASLADACRSGATHRGPSSLSGCGPGCRTCKGR